MKFLIIFSGIAVGVLFGLIPKLSKKRPLWWQCTAILCMTASIILSLTPPLGGNFVDAVSLGAISATKTAPVKVKIIHESLSNDGNRYSLNAHDFTPSKTMGRIFMSQTMATALQGADVAVVRVRWNADEKSFFAEKLIALDPLLTLPFAPALEERIRNLYFHVPLSWVATMAYFAAMIYGIGFLRTGDLALDVKSSTAAGVGTVFVILATATGMIWAHFDWGVFWNWDPRQTSIFLLLLIYAAYFALRSSVEDEESRAKLSGVYSILGFVSALFLLFVMPRLMEGLHPGSGDDSNIGPVVSPQADALNLTKQYLFALAMAAYSMMYFWIMSLFVRVRNLENQPLAQRG